MDKVLPAPRSFHIGFVLCSFSSDVLARRFAASRVQSGPRTSSAHPIAATASHFSSASIACHLSCQKNISILDTSTLLLRS